MFKILALLILLVPMTGVAQWIKHEVDTTAGFRGLSVVSEKIVWASGTGGTVIRTVDGGKTWKVMTVPGGEKLDFRDIEAFDANTAYVLSIGNGDASRIYKTTNGGATWKLQFANKDEKAFYDAIACWDRNNCIAMSDPVDGKYVLIDTSDGGRNWNRIAGDQMPEAKEGEAAFAASGTCLQIAPGGDIFLVSGGRDARVFRSRDRGQTWTVANTEIAKGTPGSGIFSIAMYDSKKGVIVGGNYEVPDERNNAFAMTFDGGLHWSPGARPFGYRSAATFVDRNIVIAVGTNGADVSYGRSVTWEKLGEENLNAVAAKGRNAVWAAGPNGQVFRLDPASLTPRALPTNKDLEFHYYRVESLNLSHSEVSSDCPYSDSECSNERKIKIGVVDRMGDYPSYEYVYTVTAGKIIGDGPNVEWDLTGVKPGTYTITAGISIPLLEGSRWGVVGMTMTLPVVVR